MTQLEAPREPRPRILIGNDQEWSSRSLETVLGQAGFDTARAYTGKQILEVATREAFDAILVDRSLPDMAGSDLVTRLRGHPAFDPSVPIVLLTTGTPSRDQRLEAYRVGAWELLAEPWDVEALLLKLQLFIAARRAVVRGR